MRPRRYGRRMLLVALLLSFAMPGSTSLAATPYLDRRSGATITASTQALVFARTRTALAVNARDYVSLTAIDVDRSGRHTQYWWGYVWSTIDGGDAGGAAPVAGWLLVADGRPIKLSAVAAAPAELGVVAPPLARPVRGARVVMYTTDAEVLGYVAGSNELRLQSMDGSSVFALWRDARAELKALVGRLPD